MSEIYASIKTVEQSPAATNFFISLCVIGDNNCSTVSAKYTIATLASVRFHFVWNRSNVIVTKMKVSTMKHKLAEHSAVKMCASWQDTSVSAPKSWFCTDNWVEECLGEQKCDLYATHEEKSLSMYHFEVNITANKVTLMGELFYNYNDKNFTDFQLTAAEGSVCVHKLALATHSEMFKTMLGGEWKKTAEGRIELEGATLQTLQHLKDYMYLGTLPDDGLRPLLLLARRYLIENLEKDCILKLAQSVKPEDLLDLLDFARENQMPKLTFAVLRHTSVATVESANKLLEEMQISEAEDKE